VEKNLKEIEKSAEVLSGSKRSEMHEKAKRKARSNSTTKTVGNHTTVSIKPSFLSNTIETAIKDAENSLRNESTSLSHYRTILGRMLYFYQHAMNARQRLDNQFQMKAMEIQNSGQPK
jgi:hypothetical protein